MTQVEVDREDANADGLLELEGIATVDVCSPSKTTNFYLSSMSSSFQCCSKLFSLLLWWLSCPDSAGVADAL